MDNEEFDLGTNSNCSLLTLLITVFMMSHVDECNVQLTDARSVNSMVCIQLGYI